MNRTSPSLARQSWSLLRGFSLCLVAYAGLPATAAAELPGRLFTSAAERAAIDELRARSGAASNDVGQAPPDAAPQITLNGVVRRSSGRSTTWVNQQPRHENQGAIVPGNPSRPASAVLPLPSGVRVELQAGQTFDGASGTVRDAYQGKGAGR